MTFISVPFKVPNPQCCNLANTLMTWLSAENPRSRSADDGQNKSNAKNTQLFDNSFSTKSTASTAMITNMNSHPNIAETDHIVKIPMSPSEVELAELQRLSEARNALSVALSHCDGISWPVTRAALERALEYHALLEEFDWWGFPMRCPKQAGRANGVTIDDSDDSSNDDTMHNRARKSHKEDNGDLDEGDADIYWNSAFGSQSERRPIHILDLRYEKLVTLFNIGALKGALATLENLSTKEGLVKATKLFSQSAAIFIRMRMLIASDQGNGKDVNSEGIDETIHSRNIESLAELSKLDIDLSAPILYFCEKSMLAMGQYCIYKSTFLASNKPKHSLLSKIAAGISKLSLEASSKLSSDDSLLSSSQSSMGDSLRSSTFSNGMDRPNHAMTDIDIRLIIPRTINCWTLYLESVSSFFNAKAYYHESIVSRSKRQSQKETAWLTEAICACREACILYDNCAKATEERLGRCERYEAFSRELTERLVMAETEWSESENESDDDRSQASDGDFADVSLLIADIRGQVLVKPASLETMGEELSRSYWRKRRGKDNNRKQDRSGSLSNATSFTDTPNQSKYFFSKALTPIARSMMHNFYDDIYDTIQQYTELVKHESEKARNALEEVNLPQSLAAYCASLHSAGGLSDDLWEHIHSRQKLNDYEKLNFRLEELKHRAKRAREALVDLEAHLDDDLHLDHQFWKRNAGLDGGMSRDGSEDPIETRLSNAFQAQESARKKFSACKLLLDEARKGDDIVLKVLDSFQNDSTLQLLRKSREDLDQLLPATKMESQVDTSALTEALLNLSNLLKDREGILLQLEVHADSIYLKDELKEVDEKVSGFASEDDYYEIFVDAQNSLNRFIQRIQRNIRIQNDMLEDVLDENERFVKSLQKSSAALSPEQHLVKNIEKALTMVANVKGQVDEGQRFYGVVEARIKELKDEASKVSVHLATKRCEYEDRMGISTSTSTLRDNDTTTLGLSHDTGRPDPPSLDEFSHHRHRRQQKPHQHHTRRPQTYESERERDKIVPFSPQKQASSMPLRSSASNSKQNSSNHYPSANEKHVSNYASKPDHTKIAVDDEKVASLIGMDFDPEEAYVALQMHNNNLEAALNQLLSG